MNDEFSSLEVWQMQSEDNWSCIMNELPSPPLRKTKQSELLESMEKYWKVLEVFCILNILPCSTKIFDRSALLSNGEYCRYCQKWVVTFWLVPNNTQIWFPWTIFNVYDLKTKYHLCKGFFVYFEFYTGIRCSTLDPPPAQFTKMLPLMLFWLSNLTPRILPWTDLLG